MKKNRKFLEDTKKNEIFGREIAPPQVDPEKCKGCGQCVKVCPALVFELKEMKSKVTYGRGCYACGHCWAVCPEEAVFQQEVATSTSIKPGPAPAVSPVALQLLLRERRSIRLFKAEEVSKEQLRQVIDAGRFAPTASNRQDVKYIVLFGSQNISALRSLVESFMVKTFKAMQNRFVTFLYRIKHGSSAADLLHHYAMAYQFLKSSKEKNAYFPLPLGSAVIIVHARKFDRMAQFNCSIALYNCSLMAHSMGLGSCFMGFVQIGGNMEQKIRQWLDIPKENEVYGAIVVGHPDVTYRRLVERRKPDIKWI